MQQEFINEIIANEEDINDELFWNYFKYQNPLFLAKYLIRAKQAKNEQLPNNADNELIDLRNSFIKKEISENEKPNKKVEIAEKILDFNKQQKSKGIKLLTPKQMLQRLPIALAQVKAGNTSEKLLNEIRQVLYYFIEKRKLLKKYLAI